MTVSDTKHAEGLGDLFKDLGKKHSMHLKSWQKLFQAGRALEIGANVGTAFASRNRKAVLSTLLELINFYHTGEGL